VRTDPRAAEIVSGFTLTVAPAGPSSEAEARWARRAEVLANWLLGEWQQARAMALQDERAGNLGLSDGDGRTDTSVT
jgi:hypothetical protein